MLSSDKNVETIAHMAEVGKEYVGLQKQHLELSIVDKLVRVLMTLGLLIIFAFVVIAIIVLLSIAVGFWLASYVGYVAAFFIVAAIHMLLFLLLMAYRGPLIQRPLLRFVASLFLEGHSYQSIAQIPAEKSEVEGNIKASEERFSAMWSSLFVSPSKSSKGEWVSALIANGITAVDALLLIRKLYGKYGHLIRKKK